MYTALSDGSVVGIVTGLAAVDGEQYNPSDAPALKGRREAAFPSELLRKGMAFDCAKGEASVAADRDNIINEIGGMSAQLNWSVHGRVAAASLRPALEQGGELAKQALKAIGSGKLVRLELAMTGSTADTMQNVQSLVSALDEQTLQELVLHSQCWKQARFWLTKALGERVFAKMLKLDLQTNLAGRAGIKAVSAALKAGRWPSLQHLNIQYNYAGPDAIKSLAGALEAGGCPSLRLLKIRSNLAGPDGINAVSVALEACACPLLEHLDIEKNEAGPEGINAIAAVLAVGGCPALRLLEIGGNDFGGSCGAVDILTDRGVEVLNTW